MLFVLGIVLIVIGIGVSTISRTETRYQNYYGFQVPYQATVQPYVGVGIFMAIVGFVVVIGGLIKIGRGKFTTTVKYAQRQPPPSYYQPPYYQEPPTPTTYETATTPCEYCGTLMPQTAHFCPNCGAKKGTRT